MLLVFSYTLRRFFFSCAFQVTNDTFLKATNLSTQCELRIQYTGFSSIPMKSNVINWLNATTAFIMTR